MTLGQATHPHTSGNPAKDQRMEIIQRHERLVLCAYQNGIFHFTCHRSSSFRGLLIARFLFLEKILSSEEGRSCVMLYFT